MSDTDPQMRAAIQRGGLFEELTLDPLSNTGNNRVYRMETVGGTFLVKQYFQHPDDPRDRFAAERAFYSCLWAAGIRRIPGPVQWLVEERLGIFEFLPGEKPTAADASMVAQAIDFFREMNGARGTGLATALPSASEACFSLAGHLECVGRRVMRLSGIAPETEIDRKAVEFVSSKINPAWKRLESSIVAGVGAGALDSKLPQEARCISPSDFGFHNSMRQSDGHLRFFDFEYAGWDDPAKTVCDFFCQPAVPVDRAHLGEFLGMVAQIFPASGVEERVKSLLPLYQLKWCCIILNEFLSPSAARRRFSSGGVDQNERKAAQLARAEKLCASIQ
ncbi:MAG TPA: aminoglycoside phosphotransferase family protein [Chthoniobacteraceae bacterium]|nr:aminoglycoside phosphotransferase family protein [Chthoniobacteraceae bacterium]